MRIRSILPHTLISTACLLAISGWVLEANPGELVTSEETKTEAINPVEQVIHSDGTLCLQEIRDPFTERGNRRYLHPQKGRSRSRRNSKPKAMQKWAPRC